MFEIKTDIVINKSGETDKLSVSSDDLNGLLPENGLDFTTAIKADASRAIVVGRHRFYNQLNIELIEAKITRNGKLKNPLKRIDPSDLIWQAGNAEELKFYSGIIHFQNNYDEERSDSDLAALKAVIKNPMELQVYQHEMDSSSNINAGSVSPVQIKVLVPDLRLSVNKREDYYEVTGTLLIGGKSYALENIKLKYRYFIELAKTLYLVDNNYFLHVIAFFKRQQDRLVVPPSEFDDFQQNVLSRLEEKVRISYSYLKQATQKQIKENGFDLENEQLIYLSESEDFVLLTPVMRYGDLEIPVLSQKQIQSRDKTGKVFTLKRDEEKELLFITQLVRQHPYFKEQLGKMKDINAKIKTDCFYLHKKYFTDPQWFLNAFDEWRNRNILLLGFNELKDNKLNPYKAEIRIQVNSGMDWFETAVKIKYGRQMVSLKNLHKSLRNKSRFVALDDGTFGILPDEWIAKFSDYFSAGEVVGESIRTEKINFNAIADFYEEEMMDISVMEELSLLRDKLSGPEAIGEIEVPEGLNLALRDYQKQGLYWLNFLDQFNFGACLADDMGLGKTVQILAFILSQRDKDHHNSNLIVVPASLVFNWQAEIHKFAPSIKIHTIYGAERSRGKVDYGAYEVILTSYGTLLADIRYLKEYRFNYIFLDESQNIKNPESQRYKAVRLLQSRNKVVLTGTPIENNTFDLYGQLSFACPGLLGSKQQFKELYSVPIDQFKDSRRASELQKKVNPFILRRTKEQVAKELPDKTEMVIYCEMGAEQREIYDAYAKEIRDYLLGIAEDELPKSSMHVLQGITKLRQICNAPALLSEAKFYGSASAKMDVLLEQIETKAPHHKILVFSQFVTMLDLIRKELEKKGIAFEYLTGQTRKRAEVVNSFQEDPLKRVFLISLKAGGVGLNLTEADYVYLVDPWWNPAVENQAIDRTYRIGQHKNVMAVRLICPDTIEEKIMLIQDNKKNLSGDLIKTEDSIFKSLTKKELMGLLTV